MPKQTFLNLPEEKRNKIIDAALEEFSTKGFKAASINIIVAKAEIPKGSFYQYFKDKKDVFKHICILAGKEKMSFINKHMPKDPDLDFFQLFKKLYTIGIRFGKEHKEYYRISNDILNDYEMRKEVFGEQYSKVEDFFSPFLKAGIERGDVRNELNIEFYARILTTMFISMGEYFIEKHGWENIDELENYSDMFIDLIKNGIARRHSDD